MLWQWGHSIIPGKESLKADALLLLRRALDILVFGTAPIVFTPHPQAKYPKH